MTEMIHQRSARDLARAIGKHELSAAAVVDHFLARIEAYDSGLNAFVETWPETARAKAQAIDSARDRGLALGPLAGVPFAIKDNFCRRGRHVTCASEMLANFRAPYTATAVDRLETAGAILIGRTNMDEFAMGSSCERSRYGKTHNPYDRSRTAGGSSGGSAVAVAARLVPFALGSDTGGSVRQPAAFTGITGMKPTYGRISRHGLIALASSLDHVGMLTRDAEDLRILLQVMAGPDPKDATSLAEPLILDPALDTIIGTKTGSPLAGMRIGIPREYFAEDLESELEQHCRQALNALRELGAELIDLSLPHTQLAIPTYYTVCVAEAASNLSRYDGVHFGHRTTACDSLDTLYTRSRSEGFGDEVKRRILLGTYCLQASTVDAHYRQATKVRALIRQDFDRAFEGCDILVGPTTPSAAFALGSRLDDPLSMYQSDALTTPANLAGIPALSTPCGFTAAGLPVALQFLAPNRGEAQVLRTAQIYQSAHPFHLQEPEL